MYISKINNIPKLVVCLLLSYVCLSPAVVLQAYTASDFNAKPPFITAGVPPLVMLVMERDDKLYSAAYNDASNLKIGMSIDDGTPDIRYSPDKLDYYGYFDSNKCYAYSGGRYNPTGPTLTGTKKCTGQTGRWSGDWLNYVTMSRMDTVRRVLYGGHRIVDTTTETVLQRTYIPQDAHTWGKEYLSVTNDKYDISEYTPLSVPSAGTRHLFANTTLSDNNSTPNLDKPLLRVLQNNSCRLWDWIAKERPEADNTCGTPTDYIVKVKVCDPTKGLEDNCKMYTDGTTTTYKPTGILQRYGESDSMYFGLITGSYRNNLSGGVLRKNMSSIKNEIDTLGRIVNPAASYALNSASTNAAAGSIITTLNNMRVTGYTYSDYSYNTNCGWITNRFINEGECRMWGNPIGEMMFEALNYFSGSKTPTPGFPYDYTVTTGWQADDYSLGLPHPNWIDPYDTANGGFEYCAKPFMLVLSDINPSFDSNSVPGANPGFPNGMSEEAIGNTTDKLNAEKLADLITTEETINISNQYYIGDNITTNNGICSAKDITGLGDIRGLCPEEPTKQGSYYAAAVAYYGRTHDISSADDDQNVITYAVGLASALPKISIKIGADEKTITLVPFGKSVKYNAPCAIGTKDCTDPSPLRYQPTNSIAAFFVDTLTDTYGKFRINFEDSEQGSDHDQDALVIYEYQIVDNSGNPVALATNGTKVKITLTSTAAAGSVVQHMGYVISGTKGIHPVGDGTYLVVRDTDTTAANDPNYYLDVPLHPGTALPLKDERTFEPSGDTAAQILGDPLWYAAKYGGFDEDPLHPIIVHPDTSLPQTTPSYRTLEQKEWDKNSDGIPDTYYYVTNPNRLEEQLNKSFSDILRRQSSGTAASVISNSRSGEGAVYQSVFYPWNSDAVGSGHVVTWVGDVNSLFVDANGNLREDTNGDMQLNVLTTPNLTPSPLSATDCGDLFVVYGEDLDKRPVISKYKDCNGNSVLDDDELVPPFMFVDHVLMNDVKINYLWTAGNWLNNLSDPATQRSTYDAVATDPVYDKRYIFTFVDHDNTMIPDVQTPGSGKLPFFSSSTLPSATDVTDTTKFYPYLNVYPPFSTPPAYIAGWLSNTTVYTDFLQHQTQREVNYIRGVDQGIYAPGSTYTLPAFRSRQFNYNKDLNTVVTWRLGDIVYSTPTLVGRPSEDLHLMYRDYTYAQFLNHYMNRRNVLYVGGNDGMLHAFNAGYYNSSLKKFDTQPTTGTAVADFPLGAELWAYVPYNLLPHLFWLTEEGYDHVYYVDEKPRVFDARIFPSDSTHINGWGTVMVVGMRLGGGTVNADLHKAAANTSPVTGDPLMSSAYIVMDITDPESPPRLMAELKFPGQTYGAGTAIPWLGGTTAAAGALPGLGYTTCYPGAIAMGEVPTSTSQNDYYLVFGSGPAESDGKAGKAGSISLNNAASGQPAAIYVIDLKALGGTTSTYTSTDRKIVTLDGKDNAFKEFNPNMLITDDEYHPAYYKALDTNAFISDPITVDYQLDYKADAVYFGTVSGNESPTGWSGKMRRIVINNDPSPTSWIGDSVLLDAGAVHQPITAAPTSSVDMEGNRWIFFGTGRFFVNADKDNTDPQSFYGIKEPNSNPGVATIATDWPTVVRANLYDVTNVKVYSESKVLDGTQKTWDAFAALIDDGWKINFNTSNGERNVGQAGILGSTLVFTTYVPPSNECDFAGESFLYALYYTTGSAYHRSIIGENTDGSMKTHLSLGQGLVTTPNLHVGGEEGSTAFMQTSTGEILTIPISNVTATKSGMKSWRVFEP